VRQRGDFAEAESNLTTALALQRKFLGDQSPDYLYTLDSLGFTLEQRGRWAEAEAAHRETMTGWRRRGGVHYVWALAEAEGLVRALSAEKKYDDAEQVLAEILTPDFVQQKAAAGLLACRVEIRGRRAQWAGAAADAQLVLPLQPDEQYHYLRLAALLVATHDRAGYEKLCRQMLAVFTNISSPYVADRVAKNCLLLPHSGANLQLADQLADLAVTAGGEQLALPYFHTCKAMAQYRLGHFPEAIDWAKKTLNSPANNAKANAYAVLALAYWQLGQKDIAGQMLARGNMLNQATSPDGKDIDLGEAWLSWLFARLWLDQAAAVIEPRATVNNSLNPL
jgi:tetratricopeptide (TPR) repeat protein